MADRRERSGWPGVLAFVLTGVLLGAIAMVFVLGNRIGENQQFDEFDESQSLSEFVLAGAELRVLSGGAEFRVRVSSDGEDRSVLLGLSGVVTGVFYSDGDSIRVHQPIVEVSGRPVFAHDGEFLFYREIVYGDSGPDVSQLQTLLNTQGEVLEVDGWFGSETQVALGRYYAVLGYDVPLAREADPVEASNDAVRSLEQASQDRQRQLARLRVSLAEAESSGGTEEHKAEVEILRVAVEDGQRELARAKEGIARAKAADERAALHDGPKLVPAEFWLLQAPLTLASVEVAVGDQIDASSVFAVHTTPQTTLLGGPDPDKILDFSVGQQVEIEIGNGESLEGTIVRIDPDQESPEVEIVIDESLEPDSSYLTRTVTDEAPKLALAVPVTAINERIGSPTFVLAVIDDQPVEIPVAVGATSGGWAAIVDESDRIQPGTQVAVGVDFGPDA